MPEHGRAGAVVYLSESLCSGSNPTGRQRNFILTDWFCPNLILYFTLTPLSRDESVFDGCLIDTAIDPTTDHHPCIASIYGPLSVLSQQLPVICSPPSGTICPFEMVRERRERQPVMCRDGISISQEAPLLSNQTR